MSEYLSTKYKNLVPYVPGEQPRDKKYIKLNTNESPFQASNNVSLDDAINNIMLYSDPTCLSLRKKIADIFKIDIDEIMFSNGSDEMLNFAFMAYTDNMTPAVFPDITYGFYKVFSNVNNTPYIEIPLKDDLSIDINDYININRTIFIANPNAPTGLALSLSDIEKIVKTNPKNIVVIDEAYVDFGSESVVPLIKKYDNLLVIGTFSKSRSMAGARLGYAIASKKIINDLNTLRYSLNPYNINSLTMSLALNVLENNDKVMDNVKKIIENRNYLTDELKKLGFSTIDSKTNFVFTKTDKISGKDLYQELKNRGVLVRHFDIERIKDYVRITIGTKDELDTLIKKIKEIIEV
ncbi:histidinol-phosphate transaminase [bacterium]|nr:histidinol-phosphate transaminase [bacterium]